MDGRRVAIARRQLWISPMFAGIAWMFLAIVWL
jgi:hypothetical protein